ncbi:MAG: AsnC family transcriptional regulator [Pseudomonadota bacterium]|nr:AsnC family transcriptional regulator [Pseudomonadota bacterium]
MNALQAEIDRDLKDAALIRAIQDGLPLVDRPYAAIGRDIGLDEQQVIARIRRLQADGDIKRFGVVVRHRELGYRANAMVVWDLPDEWVDRLGQNIGRMPFVTLSYRRPRRLPDWPYNLFTMIHGRDRAAVLKQVEQIKRRMGLTDVRCAVLFGGRRFKQRGAHYGVETPPPEAKPGQRLLDFPDRKSASGNHPAPAF